MATHTDTASVTYGKLSELLAAEKKAWLDVICPAGKDLILAHDLGTNYATILANLFPGTTWSQKTTVKCGDIIASGSIMFRNPNEVDSEDPKQLTIYKPKTAGTIQVSASKDLLYAAGLTLNKTQYWYRRSA